MTSKLPSKSAHFLCFAFFILSVSVTAQDLSLGQLTEVPEHGEVRGIASFSDGYSDNRRTFLGVWYYVKDLNRVPGGGNLLVIFERKQNKYLEVFRHAESRGDAGWQRLLPLYSSRLTGLIISASEISGDDQQWLIALVNGRFKVVYTGIGTCEFFDMDDDGYPEVLDSMWPDGDGFPETTKVLSWDGASYRFVIEVKYNARLTASVRNAVKKASRRFRPK